MIVGWVADVLEGTVADNEGIQARLSYSILKFLDAFYAVLLGIDRRYLRRKRKSPALLCRRPQCRCCEPAFGHGGGCHCHAGLQELPASHLFFPQHSLFSFSRLVVPRLEHRL